MDYIKFPEFPKIPRLTRSCTITEKLDGTNGLVSIDEQGVMRVGSRTRWITPEDDNYGFAKWCADNHEELLKLGEGNHYGEWWGTGIQKRYVDQPKTFSLFNTRRWLDKEARPKCCDVVPVLYQGIFSEDVVQQCLKKLREDGSLANPACKKPEGIIIWHDASQQYFKKTLDKDEELKGKQ
jgi:hypothetical protein